MNENQLQTFLAVVKCGSYSRAAEAMYLSQPTVSYRIQSLEEELGVRLFNHTGTAAVLTPAGHTFLPGAQHICHAMADARLSVMQYSSEHTLTLGFPEMMLQGPCSAFMAIMQLIPEAAERLKSCKLKRPPEDVQQLAQGEVDLIFGDLGQPALKDSHFGKRVLFHDKGTVCMRRDHPLANEKALSLEQLRGETIRRYDDTTFFLSQIELRLAALGMQLQDDSHLTFVQLLPHLSVAGGVIITNQRPIDVPNLVYIPLKLDKPIDVGVAWRKNHCPPLLQQLIQKLPELPPEAWM